MSDDRLILTVAAAKATVRGTRICGVYGLFDSGDLDQRIRYVGSTTHAAKRLLDHASGLLPKYRFGADGPKRKWLNELKSAGRQPIMRVLELVEGADKASPLMHSVERKWVGAYRDKGQADLNRQLTSGDELEHLREQVKNLTQEIARLRAKVAQHATTAQHVASCSCCEEPKTATQRNRRLRVCCGVAVDRGSLHPNVQDFADLA